MFTFFTTTARNLFKRDLLNACCFKEGQIVRFAYRREHISEKALAKLTRYSRHPSTLSGLSCESLQALIVFCEWHPGQDNLSDVISGHGGHNNYYRFHPIRLAHVHKVHDQGQGEVFSIDLLLQDRVSYSFAPRNEREHPADIDSFLSQFQEEFVTSHSDKVYPRSSSIGSASNHRFARIDKGLPDYIRPHNEYIKPNENSWINLVKHVSTCSGMQDATYFRVNKMCKVSRSPIFKKNVDIKSPFQQEHPRTYVRLLRGRHYRIDVEIFQPSGEFKAPKLKFEPVGVVLGPFEWQGGGSGVYQASYTLFLKHKAESEYSTMRVHVPGEGVQSPEFESLVHFAMSKWFMALVCFLLMSGVVMIIGAPEIACFFGGHCDVNVDRIGAQTFWIGLSRVLGAILIALASFLGFRKLSIGI